METFLTPELHKTFAKISLDYTYRYSLQFFDRIKRGVSSTSDRGHYEILLDMMNHDIIQYDGIAYDHLVNMDMFNAANRLANLGDMIFHNIKSKNTLFNSILYCPEELSEYQILRLRLWYEYFKGINHLFSVSYQTQDGPSLIEREGTEEFLKSKEIFNDEYIHTLTKKFPDYR